jgi:pyridoxal 5'-phosphate synthase pdxS subunit
VERTTGTFRVKSGLAEMLKGGVIMDVTTADQAKIAEDAGACAVMALERVPADIRAEGGVARMADATKVEEIMNAVSVPVMAKARIGHFVEAQILQALGVDYVDESEVLTPATRSTTSTSGHSRSRSSAAPGTWARPSGGSPRARR